MKGRQLYVALRSILTTMLAVVQPAGAAGLDCSRAANVTETAICTHDELGRADNHLALAYRQLQAAAPGQRASLRKAQLDWLVARNRCGSDVNCIETQYGQRTTAVERQLHDQIAYRPDDVDRAALDDLRQAVEAARTTDPDFALKKVIEQVRIKTGITSFSSDDQQKATRPAGVTADEWRAFVASGIENQYEDGHLYYHLMNIDGKSQRDLVVDTDSGGTDLSTFTTVLRRKGDRFVDMGATVGDDSGGGAGNTEGLSTLYSIIGRGASQEAVWIRLRGRVYAAWRDSTFGKEDVYLIRPLTNPGNLPKLTVTYRHQLSVSGEDTGSKDNRLKPLDATWSAGLARALETVDGGDSTAGGGQQKPLCPIPPTVTGSNRDAYYNFGATDYAEEVIADVPVWLGRKCYIGRLTEQFGEYGKTGLAAELVVRTPQGDGTERSFTIEGKRRIGDVKATMAPIPDPSGS